jgi:hypothetical protein
MSITRVTYLFSYLEGFEKAKFHQTLLPRTSCQYHDVRGQSFRLRQAWSFVYLCFGFTRQVGEPETKNHFFLLAAGETVSSD